VCLRAFDTTTWVREPDADNFVFNSQKSTQLNRVTVSKLFKAIARKAGLGETLQHPHVLKHYAEFRTMPSKLDQSAKTTPKISLRAI
jgi:site-specific recombinase XerD